MPTIRPTRVRWKMMALLFVIMAVTNLGRLNVSVAGKYIQDEFLLSTRTMGWILSAFAFGYAAFQIPCGWAGDHFGPRKTLAAAMVWWSGLTALMALVPRILHHTAWLSVAWGFAVIRFLTGAGEAASYPNANKMVAFWMSPRERGIGSSFLLAGVGAGGILAPMLVAWLVQVSGWRTSFYVCGGLGILLVALWSRFSSDRPQDHPAVNSAELELISAGRDTGKSAGAAYRPTPWRTLLSNSSIRALLVSYFFHGYTPYIYYSWFFIYLVRVRGFSVSRGSFWGATPFIAITIMAPLGGMVSDAAVRRFGQRRGRQFSACVGMTCSALLLWAGSHSVNNAASIILLAAAAGFSSFAAASWWATCIDLTPEHSGSLSGIMNTCANVAGGFAPILTAQIATRLGWTRALDFAALINLITAAIWIFVNADARLQNGGGQDSLSGVATSSLGTAG